MKTSLDNCLPATYKSCHNSTSNCNLDQEHKRSKRARIETRFGPNFVIFFLLDIDVLNEQNVNAYLIKEDEETYKEAMDSINVNL